MEHIFPALPRVLNELKSAKRVLLLSDFDGTLAPIVERPEMARLPDQTRCILETLSRLPGMTVGIISGRALSDLKDKINLAGLVYAGNHGFEIEGPGVNFISPIADEMRPIFRVIGKILSMTLAPFRGVFVEEKGITISVHYRQAGEHAGQQVQQVVEKSVAAHRFAGLLKITRGKKVLELRPAVPWDKGRAVRLLMKRYGKGGRMSGLIPVYLGDDQTDEDAFKVINAYGLGLSIRVGDNSQASLAQYYLRSPVEVPLFLAGIARISPGRSVCPELSTL